MRTLEDVRSRAARFCAERNWEQFHTPTNLALALVGEVGEVSEIFQWKGPGMDKLTPEEVVHAGEELSDVFIYATRLCQQCDIDLAKCVNNFIDCQGVLLNDQFEVRPDSQNGASWDSSVCFESISSKLLIEETNPRFFAMKLSSQTGVLADLFTQQHNMESPLGLRNWSPHQLKTIGFTIASIAVILCSLSKLLGLSLNECIARKMDKNDLKYPADRSKGSSAKYTVYAADKKQGPLLFSMGFFLLGLFLGRRLPPVRF